MAQLKNALAEEYGILDKRIKNLEKVNVFAVDDRHSSDVGADKDFLSPFCAILAHIKSETEIEVALSRNVPLSPTVEQWIAETGASYNGKSWPTSRLSIVLSPGDQGKLTSLASAIRSIVAPGAPRYAVASYKYTCPRTAASLERLKRTLDQVWSN